MVRINKFRYLEVFIVFIFLIFLIGNVKASCAEDYKSLESYYKASADEDFSSYIALMDVDYIYSHLATKEDYENYVKSAWEVYDVIDYDLEELKCVDLPTGSLIFFNVKSEIEMDGEKTNLDRDYVAVFEKGKLQFVIDQETFNLHQSQAYMLMYYNVTEDIVKKEIALAEQASNFDFDELDNASSSSSLGSDGDFSYWWLFLVLILVLLGFIFYKRGKDKSVGGISGVVEERKSSKISDDRKKNEIKKKDSKKKEKVNEYITKSKEMSKRSYVKTKEISKDLYKKAKPKIIKSAQITKQYVKEAVKKSKPIVIKVSKGIAKKSVELSKKASKKMKNIKEKKVNSENKSNKKKEN